MTKQENENMNQHKSTKNYKQLADEEVNQKKKIIRKIPFKKQLKDQKDNNELKYWKPTKINDFNLKKQQKIEKKTTNIGISFLSSLPKPSYSEQKFQHQNNNLVTNNQVKPLLKNRLKLSQQQMKWDGEDQFLHRQKNCLQIQKLNQNQKFLQNEVQNEQFVQKIEWLNEEKQKKQQNLLDKIQKNWEKQEKNIQDQLNEEQNQYSKKYLSKGNFKINKK